MEVREDNLKVLGAELLEKGEVSVVELPMPTTYLGLLEERPVGKVFPDVYAEAVAKQKGLPLYLALDILPGRQRTVDGMRSGHGFCPSVGRFDEGMAVNQVQTAHRNFGCCKASQAVDAPTYPRTMCGRYTNTAGVEELNARLRIPIQTTEGTRRYNIAPTERVLAVVAPHGEPEARLLRWGLIPPWASDLKGGAKLINARVETVAQRSPFRALIPKASRRALQVADGYFE